MPGDSLKLLLIQRDRITAQKLQMGLAAAERRNHEACHVASLAAALGLLARSRFDAVLYDLKTDDNPSLAAALAALKSEAAAPLLLLCDDPEAARPRELVAAGIADAVLEDPADGRGLLRLLRGAIERDTLTRELTLSRRQAKAAQQQVREILESCGDGMLVLGDDARVLFANKAAAAMLERPAGQLVGEVFEDLALGGKTVEVSIPRKDDEDLAVELRLSETRWDGGPALIATLRDVSARRRTEAALRNAERQVQWANSQKAEFLANMSHELRTPLNSILGFAEVIGGAMFGPVGHSKYAEYASDIHRSASHLLGLVTDLLDVSCAETDRFELSEVTFSVAATLRSSARRLRPELRAAGLGLIVEIDAVEGVALYGDEPRIQQAVVNLLSNAIGLTAPGGRIRLGGRCDPSGNLIVTIDDNGAGMASDRIQEAYLTPIQVGSIGTRVTPKSSVVSLALARALIELHGGWVELESEPGRGTSVAVTLPVDRVTRPPANVVGALAKIMPFDIGRRGGAA